MKPWQMYLLAAAITATVLLLAIRSAVIKKRKQKQRDFDRKLETVLKDKETVQVISTDRDGRCILTNQRLLFDTRNGFQAVPFSKIKAISGVTGDGKKTVAPAKMASVTIKAGQEYTMYNTGEDFVTLVKELKKKTAKKKT